MLLAASGDLPVARFFLVLAAILIAGKLAGEAFERLGQPPVLGELLAGILLGRGLLGLIPVAHDDPLTPVFTLLADAGVAVLLFEIGLEMDLKEMRRVGGGATAVALVGVALPFILGVLYDRFALPESLLEPGSDRMAVSVYIGAALTATSVGITARVLADLHRMRSTEARLILGAAVIDDVLGLVILGVVSGFVAGSVVTIVGVGESLAVAFGFLIVAVLVGVRLAPQVLEVVEHMRGRGVFVTVAVGSLLAMGAVAGLAGSASIIGAFATGLVFAGTKQRHRIAEQMRPVSDVFTPIFFLYIGATVDLSAWNPFDPRGRVTLLVGGALTAIAIIGKLASGWAVPWRRFNRWAVGLGMMPRGEVGLIFAQIGLGTGLLSPALFSAILLMVIVTTLLAPPLLTVAFRHVPAAAA